MKLRKIIILFITLSIISCKKDDDGMQGPDLRPEKEVAQENQQQIEDFLESHFLKMVDNPNNVDYQNIEFDTLAGPNTGETALIDSPYLKHKTVSTDSVDYKVYYLQIRKGVSTAYQPTFADQVILTYQTVSLSGDVLDENVNPTKMNFVQPEGSQNAGEPGVIRGFIAGVTEFKGASGVEENSDGTLTFNDDFGIGAVFIPSRLGYFNRNIGAGAYQPLTLTFQLYKGIQLDSDNDGIPDYMEDLNGNEFLLDDDTDGNRVPNYLDADDDGDGTPTREEIEVNDANGDGVITEDEIIFTDSNNSGTPDYLDPAVY